MGCSDKRLTATDVAGYYERTDKGFKEWLAVKEDGTFVQTVTTADGQTLELTNKWSLEARGVKFYQFYVTYDIEKRVQLIPPKLDYDFRCYWVKNHLIYNDDVYRYVFDK